MRVRIAPALALALAAALVAAPAAGQPVSLRDSFPLGSNASLLCSAQVSGRDKALESMFDQAWNVICRDAAVPVAQLYALRVTGEDPAARLAGLRAQKAECGEAKTGRIESLGEVAIVDCTLAGADIAYRAYLWRTANRLYVAEGFAGYDSALQLGLRTIVADRPVEGEISIATTGAGDPAAFARAQAGAMDPARALVEAYRRNNSGSYAESAEFFGALLTEEQRGGSKAEALANQALQQSNLGNYGEADALFTEMDSLVGEDPVMARRLRNYRAMHMMNQQDAPAALAELARPVPPIAAAEGEGVANLVIDAPIAALLNSESPAARRLGTASPNLLPAERARILDGQGHYLRGTILRLEERPGDAAASLAAALGELAAVRAGRVTSTFWMRAQVYGELAALAERRGDAGEAERQHLAALALLEANYPDSSALLSAQSRLAAYYARSGRTGPALALFGRIVDASAQSGIAAPALRQNLAPYFALLAADAGPDAVAAMFKAGQILVRPGVAQTQAVLARELSGGSDEASRLFRQSVALTRDINRLRVEIARGAALPAPAAEDAARLALSRAELARLELDQVATQARLADFPRYRVVSGGAMTLAELQQVLRDGEAYYKMIVAGEASYAIFATRSSARAFRIGAGPAELETQVDALRATISKEEEGRIVTNPFDVALAHRLFGQLFAPVAGEMAGVRHLIFEPDGAMLRLPPNLLVMERGGVDAYLAASRPAAADPFDFTRIAWLGRNRDISTAVSARSFRDVRRVAPSKAANGYIGFGQNAPPRSAEVSESAFRRLMGETPSCAWPLQDWAKPISAAELAAASATLGQNSTILTGDAFTDTAIKGRGDLAEYRIMHFATHGLVTAPRPECPARPALMTSFGGGASDGLLTFAEIFDLRIDADLVILSACDTAGKASLAATREAGVTTGGDFALDGLVRAFVGAGGRSVVASHWPVPDDYDATERLISGLFTAPPGTSTAGALRAAQEVLMARPETSHPYYWSGFAIIGDGAAPVLPRG